MIDWLWQIFVQSKIDRFTDGVTLADIATILAPLATLIVGTKWIMRRVGLAKLAARHDDQMKAAGELAQREEWHQVSALVQAHGQLETRQEPFAPKTNKLRPIGYQTLYGLGLIAAVVLVAWLTR